LASGADFFHVGIHEAVSRLRNKPNRLSVVFGSIAALEKPNI